MAKGQPMLEISVKVNGHVYTKTVPARQLLIHFLRDELGLRGPKIGCDTGHCGACTIKVDGKIVKCCMMLAVQSDGAEIVAVARSRSTTSCCPVCLRASARVHPVLAVAVHQAVALPTVALGAMVIVRIRAFL